MYFRISFFRSVHIEEKSEKKLNERENELIKSIFFGYNAVQIYGQQFFIILRLKKGKKWS